MVDSALEVRRDDIAVTTVPEPRVRPAKNRSGRKADWGVGSGACAGAASGARSRARHVMSGRWVKAGMPRETRRCGEGSKAPSCRQRAGASDVRLRLI